MSNNLELLPVLDNDILKKKATDSAMAGALKSIEEYYTGYNSPFRKAITEELEKTPIGHALELPDIIALINNSLISEIDKIANTSIAQTFVPIVTRFLTRVDANIQFSEILKEFIALFKYDDEVDSDDFRITIEEESKWEWLNITLSCKKHEYGFTLHKNTSNKEPGIKTYVALGIPHEKGKSHLNMKIRIEGAELEMPFTPNILKDDFMSFMARLVLSGSAITMDVTDFDEELFPERCHCH